MARECADWLESYLEYTADTESAPIFNKWVGISTIASALRKKAWLQVGRLKVYPNLYIVLVADPGVARKSQSLSYAFNLISEIPAINTSADSGSAQGLLESLADAGAIDVVPDHGPIHHASLSVISKEFESFLSNVGGSKMLVTLTDLYDAGEKPWKHKVRQATTIVVPSVYLNILGATTPESLGSTLSSIVFGGGLASRITFVCSNQKSKKVPFPTFDQKLKDLEVKLIEDLREISRMLGAFEYSADAKAFWSDWYMNYNESEPKRIQTRKEFNGWYSRKPMLLQKLCTVLAASKARKEITIPDIEEALALAEEVERGMGVILSESVTRESVRKVDLIESVVRTHRQISEKHMLQLLWRDVEADVFDDLMRPLLKEKKIKRTYESPIDGKAEIWYHWVKEEEGGSC